MRYLAALAAVLTSLLALTLGASSVQAKGLSASACQLIYDSGVLPEVTGGRDPIINSQGDGCSAGDCWQEVKTPDGQTICHYARGVLVVLGRATSSKRARSYVHKHIARGYQRIDVGADLAAISADSGQAAIVMAVGRTEAYFGMGAASDDDPNPAWSGVRKVTIDGAHKTAKHLRRPGCPQDSGQC